jgi:transposase
LQGSSSCSRGEGRQSGHEPYKRGLNTKIHLAVDANGMPVRILITEGTRADCKEAVPLIQGLTADALLADKGYDTQEIVDYALASDMAVVIPPKRTRKEQREYDQHLYKLRHLVENAFLHLKRWRGIATRYAKNSASFLAAVQIRCIAIWATALA